MCGASWMESSLRASTSFLQRSHLYLFCPRRSSALTSMPSAARSEGRLLTCTERSRKVSKVSELLRHCRQDTRDRNLPAKSRWIRVVSFNDGRCFLCVRHRRRLFCQRAHSVAGWKAARQFDCMASSRNLRNSCASSCLPGRKWGAISTNPNVREAS
jgi:hypothetical protein